MPDILHKIGIQSSVDEAYKALTTREGLAAWWTRDTLDESEAGGTVRFRFWGNQGFDMKVLELDPGKRVLWQVVDGPEDWLGTKVSFDLAQEEDYAVVRFKHAGWKAPVDFMHHCSTKWGMFLMSLKSVLEGGTGTPWPNDIKLDKWEVEAG
ncbi:MAG: SRPBCC domain-containing protein [Proteobacteria bacterium]|nr:SRPBCC domain-containing protein [Pseudomonadota bacterium]